MKYLYHYYEKGTQPFRNLSFLNIEDANRVLNDLIDTNPEYWYLKKYGGFLERRRELETKAREIFKIKGGMTYTHAPHYLVVGECEFLKSWFVNPEVLKIPIDEFDLSAVSFCYGDIFPTFGSSKKSSKEYKNQVYTYDEITEIIQKYGLPQDWNPDGKGGYERYVEVHLWDTNPVDRYIMKYNRLKK